MYSTVHISLAENHLKCKPFDERQVCTLYIYTIHIFPTDNPMKTRYSISTGYCFETASTEIHVNIHHTNIQQCLHVCSLCNQ